jgi:hypothetical protein
MVMVTVEPHVERQCTGRRFRVVLFAYVLTGLKASRGISVWQIVKNWSTSTCPMFVKSCSNAQCFLVLVIMLDDVLNTLS